MKILINIKVLINFKKITCGYVANAPEPGPVW